LKISTCGNGGSQTRDRENYKKAPDPDNLTRAEREELRNSKKNTDLTVEPADKGNATVILNAVDYKQKISSLLEDPSYKRRKHTTFRTWQTLQIKKNSKQKPFNLQMSLRCTA
jgi:hypothetical protein